MFILGLSIGLLVGAVFLFVVFAVANRKTAGDKLHDAMMAQWDRAAKQKNEELILLQKIVDAIWKDVK